MPTTYPLPTLGPTITLAGMTIPSYTDIYQSLVASFQAIYGSDIYVAADSQDGQWLGVLAKAINDSNLAALAIFQSFSPTYSQGTHLSSLVKINGMNRLASSYSTVDLTIGGDVGTVILNGVVKDVNGKKWDLPATVTVPGSGTIVVTATCETKGAITAGIGTVTQIQSPMPLGWRSVTNASAASPGQPVETDAQLRKRQSVSTSIPANTVVGALVGAIKNIPGVSALAPYENDTDVTDANGLPPHSISMVVEGGDAAAIALVISKKKAPGVNTYGTTSQTVVTSTGIPQTIKFFVPTIRQIQVAITVTPLTGYTSTITTEMKTAIANYINALPIGQDVIIRKLDLPAQLFGAPDSATYNMLTLTACIVGGSLGTTDIAIAFNEVANCLVSNITVTP